MKLFEIKDVHGDVTCVDPDAITYMEIVSYAEPRHGISMIVSGVHIVIVMENKDKAVAVSNTLREMRDG